jgi:putative flippase GtrA
MSLLSPRGRRELARFLKFSVVGIIGAVVDFLKFSVVGIIGAVVDFGTFNVLNSIFGIWSVASSILSFTAAIISNFLWNRYWTYPDSRSKPIGQQAVQFAVVNVVGLAIRTPIFAFTEHPMIRVSDRLLGVLPANISQHITATLHLNSTILGRNLALALAVCVVLFWNFFINRIWTYSDVS